MLMMDRITEISMDGGPIPKRQYHRRVGHCAEPLVLSLPFSRRSCDAGCLGLDAMWQMIDIGLAGRAQRVKAAPLGCDVKFKAISRQTLKRVRYEVDMAK